MSGKPKPLVKSHLERISGDVFEFWQPIISEYIKARPGVYALYNDDKLYYIGLASNLKARLKTHLKDRHAGKWNFFSAYLTKDDEHLKELEALLLRIAFPKGNQIRGKFCDSENLKPRVKRDINKQHKIQIRKLMGESGHDKDIAKSGNINQNKVMADNGLTSLKISRKVQIKRIYKGKEYRAVMSQDGSILYNGYRYDSPSGAAREIVERSVNGWTFWQYKNSEGNWESIKSLRGSKRNANNKKGQAKKKVPVMAPYINKHIKIRVSYRGKMHVATVRKDGTINYNGEIFTSPSLAGLKVTNKKKLNGWKFWKYRNENGEWVYIDGLRK